MHEKKIVMMEKMQSRVIFQVTFAPKIIKRRTDKNGIFRATRNR